MEAVSNFYFDDCCKNHATDFLVFYMYIMPTQYSLNNVLTLSLLGGIFIFSPCEINESLDFENICYKYETP